MDLSTTLVRHADLLASGHTRDEIARMRRVRRLSPVRRGVYREDDTPLNAVDEHMLAAHAVAPDLAPDAAFSHVTATILHELPVWSIPMGRLHVSRPRPGGGRRRRRLHVHPAPLPPEDVVDVHGLRVTSPARTVADLARTVPQESALVVADAVLYRALRAERRKALDPSATTAAEIVEVLRRFAGRQGAPSARRLIAFADGNGQSPGESRSRLAMSRSGLPAPTLQWNPPGTRVRCDFAWPELGVVGEFDGRTKYGRSLRPDEDPAEAVWREKVREDRIRDLGFVVVRWIWAELATPEVVMDRIGAAFARQTGRSRPEPHTS